jgi:IS30 family transposase
MLYTHLSLKERFRIEILLSLDWKQFEIVLDLNRTGGTISKEINCNGGRERYNARKAHSKAFRARKEGRRLGKKLVSNVNLAKLVEKELSKSWSPEQVSGRLGVLCHETIYQWIYTERRDLICYLRRKKNKYRRRHGTKIREKRRELAKKRRIDTRPTSVEDRKEIGHWEGDTIVGGERTTGIATHVERTSGYLIADLLLQKKATPLANKTIKSFRHILVSKKKTVTYDNGSEFAEHETIEKKTGMTVYFAYPYHSWEKGTVENVNKYIRQYFIWIHINLTELKFIKR